MLRQRVSKNYSPRSAGGMCTSMTALCWNNEAGFSPSAISAGKNPPFQQMKSLSPLASSFIEKEPLGV